MSNTPLFEEFLKNLIRFVQNISKKAVHKTSFYSRKLRDYLREIELQRSLDWLKKVSPLRSIKHLKKNFKHPNFLKKFRLKSYKNFNVFHPFHFNTFKNPLNFLNRFMPSVAVEHLLNIFAIILPYSIVSYLIYPEFFANQFLQETFSLICIYAALFFWFMDYINLENSHFTNSTKLSRYRLSVAVTACAAPIFFMNNTFAVAFVEILLLIFAEFVCSEYLRGCALFSSKIPAYLVCDTFEDFYLIEKGLREKYKLLDVVIMESCSDTTFQRLRKKLRNINRLSFFPHPRRILYFSSSSLNFVGGLGKLLQISGEYSIPLFKLRYKGDVVRGDSFRLLPFSISDIDPLSISPQERSMISDAFKDKSVWIFYDGRKCVQDLIQALFDVANLTIFCASEQLMREMEAEFGAGSTESLQNAQHITQINAGFSKNIHKIKIADKSILLSTDSKPEILFFNTPLLHLNSSEDNLKEAVVKNALDVSDIANAAIKLNVKFVFFLSTTEAFETKNWIGATQRLGELYVQWISSRKTQTKFRIIRLPYCITDPAGLFSRVDDALRNDRDIFEENYIEKDGEDTLSYRHYRHYYDRDAIFHPFLKLVVHTLRDSYILPDIFSIFPDSSSKNLAEVAEIACKLLGMRLEEDVGMPALAVAESYSSDSHYSGSKFKLANSNKCEATTIDPAIFLTRAPTSLKYLEKPSWSLEQLNCMSTRDVISAVFQALNSTDRRDSEINGI